MTMVTAIVSPRARPRPRSTAPIRHERRRQDEKAPETVDDAGNCSEELDQERDGRADRRRGELGQVDRRPEAQGECDQKRQERGHYRTVYERECPEARGNGIPGGGDREA